MFHAGVITTQIGNAFACRTERTSVFKSGFLSNRFLLFGFAFELALIACMIYLPPFQALFEEGPLPLRYWPILFLYAPVMFLAEEGRKAVMRRLERRRGQRKERKRGGPCLDQARGPN
jgi:magnesium-transporting ATPase (P-type)